MQLAVFYVLIAVGFLALYLTWKSNAKCAHSGMGGAPLLCALVVDAAAAAGLCCVSGSVVVPSRAGPHCHLFGPRCLTQASSSPGCHCSLKKWKRDLVVAVDRQRGRKFEPPDAAKMYGMF